MDITFKDKMLILKSIGTIRKDGCCYKTYSLLPSHAFLVLQLCSSASFMSLTWNSGLPRPCCITQQDTHFCLMIPAPAAGNWDDATRN